MHNTPANIVADEVKDPLTSVVDGNMGSVRNDEQNKDTNTATSTNMNNDMMLHTRQTAENMASMMQMMKSMQEEISRLSKKCDGMEKALQKTNTNVTQIEKTLPKKLNANIISRLDSMEKSMQGEISILSKKCSGMEKSMQKTHNKCTQMERAIKSLDKKHFSMHCDTQKRLHDMRIDMDDIYYSVEKKLKYHETLLKNQKWKYSAPRPPYEYWEIEIYDDQAEEEDAETYLREIENVTNQLRNGTSDGFVSISAGLPYNEVFLPHWKEFANALEQYQYHPFPEGDNESNLQLWNVELPVTVINLLSKDLESTWFHKFELRSNNMGQEGINFALDYLKHNLILKQFKLYNNPINNMNDINKLHCQSIANLVTEQNKLNFFTTQSIQNGMHFIP